jgi:hypothetical protein
MGVTVSPLATMPEEKIENSHGPNIYKDTKTQNVGFS